MTNEARRGGFEVGSIIQSSGDPGATASRVKVYAKASSSITQLFAQDSGGTVYQLTPLAVTNEMWGPPPTAHPADDEFNTNTLNAAWLQTGFSGNLNFATRPAAYTAPAVNAASWENLRSSDNSSAAALAQNSWLMVQPGLGFAGAWKSISSAAFGGAVPADLFCWARMNFSWRNALGVAAGDYDCGITFFQDTGAGINFARHVTMGLSNTSQGVANTVKALSSFNAGGGETIMSETTRQNTAVTNGSIGGFYSGYIGIQKTGNVYNTWAFDDGGRLWMGDANNLGFANINAIGFWFNTASGSAANGGIPRFAIDFIRFDQVTGWTP